MKGKKQIEGLITEFLKTSPRARTIRRNALLPPEFHQPINKLPTDEQFIKNFIVHIQNSYMYNYYGPPTVNEHKLYLHKKSFVNPLSSGLVRRKSIQINDQSLDKKTILFELIKQLNKDKHSIMRYTQMQEFLINLNQEQTRQYKKFMVYLYKWLLNEKHNFGANSIYYDLCQETSELIIKKIYSAHEKGDYELFKNTEEELLVIQNLEKAREMKKANKMTEARDVYEQIYFSKMVEDVDRLEALEFMCECCKVDGNSEFLEKVIAKTKEFHLGVISKAHEKILLRTIDSINESNLPLFTDLLNSLQPFESESQLKKQIPNQPPSQSQQITRNSRLEMNDPSKNT